MAQDVIVGVADCRVSNQPESSLITYALGSCIAVVIHDPVTQVGGILHFMLPESSLDASKAEKNPYMFADTGIPMLFHQAYAQGAEKSRLVVCVAGGAQVINDAAVFNIGKRNREVLQGLITELHLKIFAEDIGGRSNRSMQ